MLFEIALDLSKYDYIIGKFISFNAKVRNVIILKLFFLSSIWGN
jgi:hypothetical protein